MQTDHTSDRDERVTGRPSIIVLSTADYHAAIWTNKQHLASRLSAQFDVYYIESLGLREPRLTTHDAMRILQRLRGKSRRPIGGDVPAPPPRLTVVSPRVIPFHRFRAVRALNRRILARAVKGIAAQSDGIVLWTFSPVSYGLSRFARGTVYHSVDLLHAVPGIPPAMIIEGERATVEEADVIISSSMGVAEHLRTVGAIDVQLWENVADIDEYRPERVTERADRVLFAGNLTPTKIDFELLEQLIDRGVRLDLAGPVGIDGSAGGERLARILRSPSVEYHGVLSVAALADVARECKVGIIPYVLNEYTEGVFPMKVFEYLGAGLTVVSTPLRSLEGKSEQGLIVASSARFADAVATALKAWTPAAGELNVAGAETHSWSRRTEQAARLILDLAARSPEAGAHADH